MIPLVGSGLISVARRQALVCGIRPMFFGVHLSFE